MAVHIVALPVIFNCCVSVLSACGSLSSGLATLIEASCFLLCRGIFTCIFSYFGFVLSLITPFITINVLSRNPVILIEETDECLAQIDSYALCRVRN